MAAAGRHPGTARGELRSLPSLPRGVSSASDPTGGTSGQARKHPPWESAGRPGRPAASAARGAEDRTAQFVDRGQGDGLPGREPRGVTLEARREPRALHELEEADRVRRLGLVARGCHTDHRPRDEPAAPREGDVAAVGGAAGGAGASPIEREGAAAGAATGRERQSLPRIVTVLTTPVPPRLWARATSACRTWFAASPRSCRTSS